MNTYNFLSQLFTITTIFKVNDKVNDQLFHFSLH